MARVLSSDEAKSAIKQIQTIINNGLSEQISALNTQGSILKDPNNWDGPLAEQFRNSTWPDTSQALEQAKTQLGELQQQLQTIADNIFTAGGAS
ncbi:pyrophosphorylase [Rothia sp. P4278]|uniref:pyrophosphorylase n=1 Tax=Rothia sp. P4278 TaxID=3402658 RepID=UPI003ADFCE80